MKTVLVVGGGTAGHVLPTIPIIERLLDSGYRVEFIGSRSGLEESLLKNIDINFSSIPTGKLRRYFSFQNVLDFFRFCLGIIHALFIVYRLRPKVVFSKGGFVTLPVVLAAWFFKVPVLAHESDRTPGLANRISLRFLKTYCTSFPIKNSVNSNARVVYTGSPLRSEILFSEAARGKEALNFSDEKPILVITGGSLGSEFINKNVRAILEDLLEVFNVLHVCGLGNFLSIDYNGYKQVEYVSENWGHMLAAADLVVSRAGANALFELLALQKVCIFVPLSRKVSRGDQISNAQYIVENNLGEVLDEEVLTPESFLEAIMQTYRNREKQAQFLKSYSKMDASAMIYDEILALMHN